MILISYAICVCTESMELDHLLAFLDTTRNHDESEIVILVDSARATKYVYETIHKHSKTTNVRWFECEFYGNFSAHKNFLTNKCKGKYVFNIDADEIPQEKLIKRAEEYARSGLYDVVFVPRINICPGYTEDFIKKHKFHVNNLGWINWPDFQGRIYKNDGNVKWVGAVHERLDGVRTTGVDPDPAFALWHIKSVEKQDKQNKLYDTISNGTHSHAKD